MSARCNRGATTLRARAARPSVELLLFLLLPLGLIASCNARPPAKPTPPPKAVEIVELATEEALKFALNSSQLDKSSLEAWRGKIAEAVTRADLEAAWREVPALSAHADFLQTKVFEVALEDGDWPKDAAKDELEAAWVAGVRNGVAKVLQNEEVR